MPRPRKPTDPFRYFHSSPEVIRLVVMLYVRFPLSLRNVEDLLFERGIDLCHETVRLWWNRFGPLFAADIRRQRVNRMRGFRHWKWNLDEVYVKINGEMHYLWRAVDHEGEVLESYVTKKRHKSAALRFMKKALKRHGPAEKIVTDGLKSYTAAMRELGNERRQEVGRHANNRAKNSHLPFRRRERAMLRFRQMKSLQKFASVHASLHNHFNSERHLVDRQTFKARRSAALMRWTAPTALMCQTEVVSNLRKETVRGTDYQNWNGYVEARFSASWSECGGRARSASQTAPERDDRVFRASGADGSGDRSLRGLPPLGPTATFVWS
jgi:putative transposase